MMSLKAPVKKTLFENLTLGVNHRANPDWTGPAPGITMVIPGNRLIQRGYGRRDSPVAIVLLNGAETTRDFFHDNPSLPIELQPIGDLAVEGSAQMPPAVIVVKLKRT